MRAPFLCVPSGFPAFARFPTELLEYVRACWGQATWRVGRRPGEGGRLREVRLRSQPWRGIPWAHRLLLMEPAAVAVGDVILLYVSGDPYPGKELLGSAVARLAGLRAATLNSVPNRPPFGLREDELLAHTFVRCLAEGDEDRPIFFPMVGSAVAALDALSALAPELWGRNLAEL